METTVNTPIAYPAIDLGEDSYRNDHAARDATGARWLVVVLYALAMAWVEAAVVFYIRTMIDRIEPYQSTPLPIAGGLGFAEMIREAATLFMLVTVGWLAGRNARSRVAYALLAFGVWDIGYYLWLMPLTGWPNALGDWDILFLLPLPWWGPVWSPVCIATLMILFGTVVVAADSGRQSIWPRRASVICVVIGVTVALGVFMFDSIQTVLGGGGTAELRELLPTDFHWEWFTVALVFLGVPVIDVLAQSQHANGLRPAFDYEYWLHHFRQNARNRPEPDWQAPISLRAETIPPLLRTLTQFQLGDGGGPCSLIAYDAKRFHGSSRAAGQLVDAWFREEASHSRLLGCAVERFGGRPITSHWSFSAFCAVRRWGSVRFELQVLLLTEIVSTAYYRVLLRRVDDPALRQMCRLILRDEAGHVDFHRDRLAHSWLSPAGWLGAPWRTQFWLCGLAAATVLWVNHGPCLRPFGATNREFYGEVIREIGGFVGRLIRSRQALAFSRDVLPTPRALPSQPVS